MLSVLTIGYGRNLFDKDNPERARLALCARTVSALHMIVFSRRHQGCAPVDANLLFIYPTNSRSRLSMLYDAYCIGSAILSSHSVTKKTNTHHATNVSREGWIVSAQDPFEAGIVAYMLHLRYGIPFQLQEHGDFFGSAWWRREHFLNEIRYVCGKWLLRRADSVRVVSKRVARHLVACGVDARIIRKLAVSSDTTPFRKDRSVSPSHNLRLLYPSAGAIVLFVGRLVREKNILSLIDAFREVVAQYPDTQLVIVGSGPEERALKKRVEMHELSSSISFIPWTTDVASYMHSADIFVLCSYREGWGRVIVEAMVAGLPGVVTDVGCVGEIFIDGRHGIVVPVDDSKALAKGIETLLAGPALRRTLGDAAVRDSSRWVAQQLPYADAWCNTIR